MKKNVSNDKNIWAFSLGICMFCSCNDDGVYDREQYKNVFALISESDNTAPKFHNLGGESIGYVAASMGGTEATEKDVVVDLVEDRSLIDRFNRTNYDTDRSKYVRPMPADKYDIDSYRFAIPAGTIGGRLPIRIRPDGLSPDSSYFIALRVDAYSAYEVNPEKSYVLYRVRTRNRFARSDGTTVYSMRGKYRQEGASELEMPGNKVVHPIGENSVRIMAGNEAYAADMNVFDRAAITITVGPDNKLAIAPYGNIQVAQADGDPDFPNVFMIEDDGIKTYKTFLLHYFYVSGNTNVEMKEELRLEFREEDELE